MKRKLLLLASLVVPACGWADSISRVTMESSSTDVGQAVNLVLEVQKPDNRPSVWCGVNINFGDGVSAEARVDKERFIVPHTYQKIGSYTVTVSGVTVFRGLQTALPCSGANQTATVQVVDPARLLAQEQERALAEANRKASEEAARLAAAALEERDRELRAKEAALQLRELELKKAQLEKEDADRKKALNERERALRQREEELAKKAKAAPVQAPAPVASRPANAAAASKPKPANPLEAF